MTIRRFFVLAVGVIAGGAAAPAMAAPGDPCSALLPAGKAVSAIDIVANGYVGRLGGAKGLGGPQDKGLEVSLRADGTYVFRGLAQFAGEAPSAIEGTCKNRLIEFARKGSGLSQQYRGYLFQKPREEKAYSANPALSCGAGHQCMAEQSRAVGQEMSGLFSHNGGRPAFGWCARVVAIEQVY